MMNFLSCGLYSNIGGEKKSQASAPLSLIPKVGPLALSCLQGSGAGAAPVTTEALVITLPAPGYLTLNTECSGKVTPGQVSCLSGSLVSPALLSWATCSPAQPPAAVPPGSRDAHRASGYGGGGRQQVTGEKDAVCPPPLRIPACLVEPSTGPCCPPPARRRHAALPPGEACPGYRSYVCDSVTLESMRRTAWGPVGWRRLRQERTFWAIGEVTWRRWNLTGFLKCKQDVDRWRSSGWVVDVGTGTGGLAEKSHWAGRRLDRPHLGSSVGWRVSGRAPLEATWGEAQVSDDTGPGRRVETKWGSSRLGVDGQTDRTDKASWGF